MTMTEKEAGKIRSAFCNGVEYPFGRGFMDRCDLDEVSRHGALLDDALTKQIPQRPLPARTPLAGGYRCPRCRGSFSGAADYCRHCGQALDWEGEAT